MAQTEPGWVAVGELFLDTGVGQWECRHHEGYLGSQNSPVTEEGVIYHPSTRTAIDGCLWGLYRLGGVLGKWLHRLTW